MRSEEARMQTFIQQLQEWSNCHLNVTPKDIVEAGMFYLGKLYKLKNVHSFTPFIVITGKTEKVAHSVLKVVFYNESIVVFFPLFYEIGINEKLQ